MIDKNKKVDFPVERYGEKTIIMGRTGSGKSYGTRVLIEEGLKKKVVFVIIDPQGAYKNLKGFEYINAKDISNAEGLGILIAQTNKNIVIETKTLSITEQNKF